MLSYNTVHYTVQDKSNLNVCEAALVCNFNHLSDITVQRCV